MWSPAAALTELAIAYICENDIGNDIYAFDNAVFPHCQYPSTINLHVPALSDVVYDTDDAVTLSRAT